MTGRHMSMLVKPECGPYRPLPTREGEWARGGDLVRLPLEMLDVGLPESLSSKDLRSFAVVCHDGTNWTSLPCQVEPLSGYGEWQGKQASGNMPTWQLVFPAPTAARPTAAEWPDAQHFEGHLDLRLWDSYHMARLEGVRLYYSTCEAASPAVDTPATLELSETDDGYSVWLDGQLVLHFAARLNFQIDQVFMPGSDTNLVAPDTVWRWALSADITDCLSPPVDEHVEFLPRITQGVDLVVEVKATSRTGAMSALMHIYTVGSSLALTLDCYRSRRTLPEPDVDGAANQLDRAPNHTSEDGIYATVLVNCPAQRLKDVWDHLSPHRTFCPDSTLQRYERNDDGQWMALNCGDAAIGLITRGHTMGNVLPWFWAKPGNGAYLGTDPYGAVVNGHFEALDSHTIILAPRVEQMQDLFERVLTHPVLVFVYPHRQPPVMAAYQCLAKWVALCSDHLLVPGRYRRAMLTSGPPTDDCQSIDLPIAEFVWLYERTRHKPFLEKASQAALFVADWFKQGYYARRGEKPLAPDDGGIYQSEHNYLLLALARVYRHVKDARLLDAIDETLAWIEDQRGGLGTWEYHDFRWHAGAYHWDGSGVYYWPVNTNQAASVNFRLYQLLGEPKYLAAATEIVDMYLGRKPKNSWPLTQGWGVSDETRGAHLWVEAWEVYPEDDPTHPGKQFAHWLGDMTDHIWLGGLPLCRHQIYREGALPGEVPSVFLSPGYSHSHSCGSITDLSARLNNSAVVGVSETLTSFAFKDGYYSFSPRFGWPTNFMISHYTWQPRPVDEAWWLDPEMLLGLYAAARRGWVPPEDLQAALWKVYTMLVNTYISLDGQHGGWAAAYDCMEGQPLKFLGSFFSGSGYAPYRSDEPREIHGFLLREASHDGFTHYRTSLEPLVADLLSVESVQQEDKNCHIELTDQSDAQGLPLLRAALVPLPAAAGEIRPEDLTVLLDGSKYDVQDTTRVAIGDTDFLLLTVHL